MARKYQMRMVYPSVKDMVSSIYSKHGYVMNIPVTKMHIDNAIQIWGPVKRSIVDKTIRKKPDAVVIDPTNIMRRYTLR